MNDPVPVNKNAALSVSMLFSRLLLFAFFQAGIALVLHSWAKSQKYWLLTATLTNVVSIVLLVALLKREGVKYLSLFRFNKNLFKKDLAIFSGLVLLSVPLIMAPPYLLSLWLWGDGVYYSKILFQPIPISLIVFLLIAFPVSISLAELVTYFGYIMPRLQSNIGIKWLAVLLPVVFLSIQHCTLPLVFDYKFIFLRGFMYLPFALMLGIALHKRPSLLPYLAILHGLFDAGTVVMLLYYTGKI